MHVCTYMCNEIRAWINIIKRTKSADIILPNPQSRRDKSPLPPPDTNHSPSSRGQQLAPPRQLSTISLYSSRDRAGRKHPRRDTNAARYPHKAALATSLAAGVSYAPFTLLSIGTRREWRPAVWLHCRRLGLRWMPWGFGIHFSAPGSLVSTSASLLSFSYCFLRKYLDENITSRKPGYTFFPVRTKRETIRQNSWNRVDPARQRPCMCCTKILAY